MAGAAALHGSAAAGADAFPRTAGGSTTLGESASEAVSPGATPRRSFLLGAAGVTAGAAVAGALGQKLAANTTIPTAADLPAPQVRLNALPMGLEKQVRGLSPFRTPIASFYRVDTSLIIPASTRTRGASRSTARWTTRSP